MNFIVLVKSKANGRILDAFGMKSEGMAFYFQNDDGKWINPEFSEGYKYKAFLLLFEEDGEFLWKPKPVMTILGRKIKVEVREQ